jgi:hypothetical protein
MNRTTIVFGALVLGLGGCSSVNGGGPVQVAADTWMISREDRTPLFCSLDTLRADVHRDADSFAHERGKVATSVHEREKAAGYMQWPSIEYVFKLVDPPARP